MKLHAKDSVRIIYNYIYIIHIIHVVLEVPIVFHSPAFGEATTGDCVPSMFDARKKKRALKLQLSHLFRRRLFDIKVLEELHLATAGRGRAALDAELKNGVPMDLQNLDFVCICVCTSEPFPFLAAHHHSQNVAS